MTFIDKIKITADGWYSYQIYVNGLDVFVPESLWSEIQLELENFISFSSEENIDIAPPQVFQSIIAVPDGDSLKGKTLRFKDASFVSEFAAFLDEGEYSVVGVESVPLSDMFKTKKTVDVDLEKLPMMDVKKKRDELLEQFTKETDPVKKEDIKHQLDKLKNVAMKKVFAALRKKKAEESSGTGYGGDRPGINVEPKRDEAVSLEAMQLNVANRQWDAEPLYDMKEGGSQFQGYTVYDDNKGKVMFIKTSKPMNKAQLEEIVFNEFNKRSMLEASVDGTYKFAMKKTAETVSHEDHEDEMLTSLDDESEAMVLCSKSHSIQWVPYHKEHKEQPLATPEAYPVEGEKREKTYTCTKCDNEFTLKEDKPSYKDPKSIVCPACKQRGGIKEGSYKQKCDTPGCKNIVTDKDLFYNPETHQTLCKNCFWKTVEKNKELNPEGSHKQKLLTCPDCSKENLTQDTLKHHLITQHKYTDNNATAFAKDVNKFSPSQKKAETVLDKREFVDKGMFSYHVGYTIEEENGKFFMQVMNGPIQIFKGPDTASIEEAESVGRAQMQEVNPGLYRNLGLNLPKAPLTRQNASLKVKAEGDPMDMPAAIRQFNKAIDQYNYDTTEYDLTTGKFKSSVIVPLKETKVRMTDPTKTKFEKSDGFGSWRMITEEEFNMWKQQWDQLNSKNYSKEPTEASLHVEAAIVHEDGKWCVKAHSGRSMGCYDTKEKAEHRLQQVEMFKNMNSSKRLSKNDNLIKMRKEALDRLEKECPECYKKFVAFAKEKGIRIQLEANPVDPKQYLGLQKGDRISMGGRTGVLTEDPFYSAPSYYMAAVQWDDRETMPHRVVLNHGSVKKIASEDIKPSIEQQVKQIRDRIQNVRTKLQTQGSSKKVADDFFEAKVEELEKQKADALAKGDKELAKKIDSKIYEMLGMGSSVLQAKEAVIGEYYVEMDPETHQWGVYHTDKPDFHKYTVTKEEAEEYARSMNSNNQKEANNDINPDGTPVMDPTGKHPIEMPAIEETLHWIAMDLDMLENAYKDNPAVIQHIEDIENEMEALEKELNNDSPKDLTKPEEIEKENAYKTPRPTTPAPDSFRWAYDPPSGQWELVAIQ